MPQKTSGRPRVSVIIPAFNAERYIRETLDSILAQTYPEVEVTVVDDGSTDGTAACVRTYGDSVRYVHQKNSGGCGSPRNAGMRAATGEFFAFLDSDDVLAPHRLQTEVEFLTRNPDVGMVFSNYRDFQGDRVHDGSHFEECPLLSRRLGPPATAAGNGAGFGGEHRVAADRELRFIVTDGPPGGGRERGRIRRDPQGHARITTSSIAFGAIPDCRHPADRVVQATALQQHECPDAEYLPSQDSDAEPPARGGAGPETPPEAEAPARNLPCRPGLLLHRTE